MGIYEGRIDVISQQPIGRMKRYITATGENTYDSFCSRNKEWRQNLGCLEELYKAFHHHYGIVMDDDVFTEAKERQHKVKIVCNSFKN